MTRNVVLYHGGCPDGFGAAMGVYMSSRNEIPSKPLQLIPVQYEQPIPNQAFKASMVFIVDFWYPFEELKSLAESGVVVTVLDHHKSAFDAAKESDMTMDVETASMVEGDAVDGKLGVTIDMERSGAGIVWDEFMPSRPPLIDYIEDGDLWKFELPSSKEVSSYVRALEHRPDVWVEALDLSAGELIAKGKASDMLYRKMIDESAEHGFMCEMGGHTFPIANTVYKLGSEVAQKLMEDHGTDMAGYWLVRGDGSFQYGFRSRNGVTVNDFAEGFGGGGHEQASGCRSVEALHTIV